MNDKQPICPLCETGELSPITYEDTFQHHGADLVVSELEGYECPLCGADPIFEDQIRRNHRRIMDAKRRADGLLTSDEIRALRERLKLTQKDAAEFFGGGANAFSKYERGDVAQSVAMDRLLRLVGRYPSLLAELKPGESTTELAAVNDRSGYSNGDPVRLRGTAHQAAVCREDATVVENESWQWKRAA
ncbi:type II toxin-antitoxin system MqsA family antitoxin [Thiocystis violacea]|uniref:type II toxin-antitoxin system MqsA family antitoxin n=1 Tax=Thiocystis violacea TaxID=13725 RepID=UPI0019072706|nr:type II toxin-antitoxin system MqsA family antitoxin [Thiocystis violacea]MBK1720978.1 hypothetical protein [Thiocystis violacea]